MKALKILAVILAMQFSIMNCWAQENKSYTIEKISDSIYCIRALSSIPVNLLVYPGTPGQYSTPVYSCSSFLSAALKELSINYNIEWITPIVDCIEYSAITSSLIVKVKNK